MSFQELLQQAGLGDYSQYFTGTGEEVAKAFGFEGDQAAQFSRFFRPFDQSRLEEAAGEIEQREATRTGFLERDYQSGLSNLQSQYQSGFQDLSRQLGQATRQIANQATRSGASFGATQRQMNESRRMVGDTLSDLMQRRQRGMESMDLGRERSLYQIGQQAGQERAGLTRLLQDYLNRTFSRGEQIAALDPGVTETPENPKSVPDQPVTIGGGNPSSRNVLGNLGMQFTDINRGTPGLPVDPTNNNLYNIGNILG
tara:strand:+ start:2773 stop:3540 length:768 start_codon:yes stop_codon:yes gene_type:complete